MTNYADLPTITLVQHEIGRCIFSKEPSVESAHLVPEILINLIKQHGFQDYDQQCIPLLQTCLVDFCKDLSIRFKQHLESLGCSISIQQVFERTLDDVQSISLQELHLYMKKN